MPAGPEPITATFLPVFARIALRLHPAVGDGAVGDRLSIVLMVTGLSIDVERAGRLRTAPGRRGR